MRGLLRVAVRNRARERAPIVLFSNIHVGLVATNVAASGVTNDTLCTAQVASISADEFGEYARPHPSAAHTRVMQAHAAYFAASQRTCRQQFMVQSAPRAGVLISAGNNTDNNTEFGQFMRGARSSVHFHPNVLEHVDAGACWTANQPSYLRICGMYANIMRYVLVPDSPIGLKSVYVNECIREPRFDHDSMLNGLSSDDLAAISGVLQCYIRELPSANITAISPRTPR